MTSGPTRSGVQQRMAARVAVWIMSQCDKCGRDLMWRPGQKRHKCGWCGRRANWPGGAA